MFPYKLYEPFQNPDSILWIGEYSKLYACCWLDEQTFNIWLFLACLFIVGCFNTAGQRQRRGHAVFWTSSLCLIWAANLFGLYSKSWMHGQFLGHGTLSRFDKGAAYYQTDLWFGLKGMNVTVTVLQPKNLSNIIFNDHLPWHRYSSRYFLHRHALERGAANPILTVMDYYDAPGELGMGADLRRATQIASDMLWFSIASTAYLMVQLAFLPQYVCYGVILNAFCLITAYVSFIVKDPRKSAEMHIEGIVVQVQYGWTFYLVVVTSTLMLLFGIALWVYKEIMHRLSVRSPWEADYETPYYWKSHNKLEKAFTPLTPEGRTKMRSYSESSAVKAPRVPENTPAMTFDSMRKGSTRLSTRKHSMDTFHCDENRIKDKYPFSAPMSRAEPSYQHVMEIKPVDVALLNRRLSELRMEQYGTPVSHDFNAVDLDSTEKMKRCELEKFYIEEKNSPDSPFEVMVSK